MMWVEVKECSAKISAVHHTFNALKTAKEEKKWQNITTIKFYQRKNGDIIFAMFCHLNCKAKKKSKRKYKKWEMLWKSGGLKNLS